MRKNLVPQRCRVGAKWLYMSGCLCAMHVMLRGAAWCAAVMCCVVMGCQDGGSWT